VEREPGVKDAARVRAFVRSARRAADDGRLAGNRDGA
jgi:hypothetical protein